MTEDGVQGERKSFLDGFAEFSARVGNQVHLRSLRDAFATVMPIYILAGIAVLINNVAFPLFLAGDALAAAQYWGNAITQGTQIHLRVRLRAQPGPPAGSGAGQPPRCAAG